MGGLDTCLGRFDTSAHSLTDKDNDYFLGKDYSNVRIKDFYEVKNINEDSINRKT